MKFEWEIINFGEKDEGLTYRAKVFGGWVLRTWNCGEGGEGIMEALVFIPDMEHRWEIECPT